MQTFSQRLFYAGIKRLVRWGSWGMFSEVKIVGMHRVPWDEPCIVSPNHQNAFLDALLIGAFAPAKMSYLSRSDVFGTRFDWFLEALQMTPVYRRRDGFEKLSRNREIFARQRENLSRGHPLLIFSEAEHAHTYYLRPLSKGSSRFALGTQVQIERDVHLVPVGINYYPLRRPGFKVSIVFGEPIGVAAYEERYREHDARAINALRDDLSRAMQDCLLIPEKTDDYCERVHRIHRHTEALPFAEMKQKLQAPSQLPEKPPYRPALETLSGSIDPFNALPAWATARMMRWVDDPVFASSLKFAAGILVLPVWWLVLFGMGTALSGWPLGATLALVAVTTALLRVALVRRADPPHVLDPEEAAVEA